MSLDPLDELASLRSIVPDPRLQPDPAVLKGIVASLKIVREDAGRLGVPEDFLRAMVRAFVQCFFKLDGLPRDDPFWEGTNRRPTQYKMGDFCWKMAQDDPGNARVLLMGAAVQVLFGHYFDPTPWGRLVQAGSSDARWPVYAAFIGFQCGGYDTAPQLARFLKHSGSFEGAKPAIDALAGSDIDWVREWAGTIGDVPGDGPIEAE